MWIVEYYSKVSLDIWYAYLMQFKTEEEANTFMVQEIFKDPSYTYRVRKQEE